MTRKAFERKLSAVCTRMLIGSADACAAQATKRATTVGDSERAWRDYNLHIHLAYIYMHARGTQGPIDHCVRQVSEISHHTTPRKQYVN